MSKRNCISGWERSPSTRIQRAYFVGRQPDLPLGGMECVGYLEFTGKRLDEEKLRLAIENIAMLPALRSLFLDADHLIQGEVRVPELTVYPRHRSQNEEHVLAIKTQMLSQSVDLTAGRLWEVALTQWHDGETTLHLAISLAVVDLPGVCALIHHLAHCYHGEPLLPHIVSAEYLQQQLSESRARIERKRQRNPRKLAKLAEGRTDTLLPPPQLPFTFCEPAIAPVVVRRSRLYNAQQWVTLRKAAAGLGVAPSALVLALYARALRLYSATPDFIITVTHVSTAGSEMLLAERTSTYLHRARSADSLETQIRDTQDDLQYRLLRGIESETELRGAQADAEHPHTGLSPYIFTYSAQQPVFSAQALETFGQPHMWAQTPQVVIDCQVFQLNEQQIEVAFDVRRAAIAEDVDAAIFDLFTESIDDVIAGRSVGRMLPEATRKWREQVNATPLASPPGMLFSAFRQQVEQQPQAIALVGFAADPDLTPELIDPLVGYTSQQWRYHELDNLALRLAAHLVQHTDAGDIVGIRLPKGPSQIVAVLATLYAGCAYLPVGLDMPEERLAKIRQRSSMRYLLTTDDFGNLAQIQPLTALRLPEQNPDAVAYVIFTSGSTGEPKGVAVSHRAANNTIVDVNTRHNVTPNDVLLAVSSLDFDLSVYDIFGPLSRGGCIVTINENERRDAFRWADRIKAWQVTLWNSVPALAEMLVTATDELPSLRAWLCSGDWIAPSLFSRLKRCSPQSILVAMGGSTEAAIWSNEYVIREPEDIKAHWPSVPYGLPLSGQQYRVVREDASGQFVDCPDGVTGELWIGGEGLAQGYLGDAERSNERFVYATFTPDTDATRWYRTGDLGYWREALLFFVGRLDTQVKIRGHRVECGEVEQTLKSLSGVANAVVVPIRQRRALGAVLVCHTPDVDLNALRQQLSRQLPHYMIPARFLLCEALPLNRNGKIDRQWAASHLEVDEPARQPNAQNVHPAFFTACQQGWCQVLQRDSVNAEDNFFALGGDSLAATRLCAILQTKGVQVAVGELFATHTLERFAERCQACAVETPCKTLPEEAQWQPFPLTSLQRAYALGADGIPGVSRCDTVFSVIIRSPDAYPLARWQQALDALISETAALRLVRSETRQQVISAKPVPNITLEEPQKLEDFLANTPLNARQHPPLMMVTMAGEPTRIGLMFNYLSLDALSLSRITRALIARVTNEPVELETHIAPFQRYAEEQAKQEARPSQWQPEDWRPPHLPSTQVSAAISRIASLTWCLDAPTRHQLEARAQQACVTLSALVLQAFGEAMIALSDGPQVVVVVPICWRPASSSQALGQFTQLRLCRLVKGNSATEVAHALADAVGGLTPDDRYIATQGRAAYPFVFTCTAGMPEAESLYNWETGIEWTHTRTPGVLIDCQVQPDGDGLEIRWDYAAGALDDAQLKAVHAQFVAQLMQKDRVAERVIAAALTAIGNVPEALAPVVAAWQRLPALEADNAWQVPGEFLAACVNGERPRSDLLRHPLLAPERLLLASLHQMGFFTNLVGELRANFSHPRVLILGAGSGVFSQALALAAAENALPLTIDEYESNAVLNTLAGRNTFPGETSPSESVLPDVVIAPASLHRDDALLARLATLRAATPIRLYVLEVTEPDAASLIAAILDPGLVDGGDSPLLSAAEWAQRLQQLGAEVEQMQPLATNLVWIKARLAVQPCSPDAEMEIARCWASVLKVELPLPPAADFFALGGDSLRATQIVTTLRQRGYSSLRLADLFNHPTFADFVEKARAHQTTSSRPPEMPAQSENFPLTALQKAYLAGRSPEQLLGGVASHCYFEFSLPQGIDIARWQHAVSNVIARHDALRSRVIWQDGVPSGRVTAQVDEAIAITDDVRSLTESETPDPEQDYPLRVRVSPDGKTIGIGMDNLMLDGASMLLVLRELGATYQGQAISPPPAITYAQYRNRSHKAPQTGAVKRMPPAPRLPYRTTLDKPAHLHFARCACELEESVWRAVRQQASELRVTPAAILLAAYALEIAEQAEVATFSLNVTTFERDPDIPGAATMVGDFTRLGLVAFETDPAATQPEQRHHQLVEQAKVAHQGILTLHETPEQVSTLLVARDIVREQGEPLAGLFPVVFTCGLGLSANASRSDDYGFGTLAYARSQTPQVTMDLQVHDDARGLHITVDYVTELLASEQVSTLAAGVVRRLEEWVEPSSASLSSHIARIWRHYLPNEAALPLENFFQAGGDSLQATRCIRALQDEIDPAISLRLLLMYPRFSDFCAQVAQLIARQEPPAGSRTDYEEGTL